MPELIRPATQVHASFLEAMEEFTAEGVRDSQTAGWIARWGSGWHSASVFATFVEALHADAREETSRPAAHVPATTLWWVEGDTYLGRLAIRHRLTDFLLEVGGHIGYDVRPSRRRRGHATAMLRAALPVAHELGIDPALLTCDHDNLASARVIESADGVLEDRRGRKLRYWVPTGRSLGGSPVGSGRAAG